MLKKHKFLFLAVLVFMALSSGEKPVEVSSSPVIENIRAPDGNITNITNVIMHDCPGDKNGVDFSVSLGDMLLVFDYVFDDKLNKKNKSNRKDKNK